MFLTIKNFISSFIFQKPKAPKPRFRILQDGYGFKIYELEEYMDDYAYNPLYSGPFSTLDDAENFITKKINKENEEKEKSKIIAIYEY